MFTISAGSNPGSGALMGSHGLYSIDRTFFIIIIIIILFLYYFCLIFIILIFCQGSGWVPGGFWVVPTGSGMFKVCSAFYIHPSTSK